MKRGYKRILIFDVILIIMLLLNSFSLNLLSRYGMLLFLLVIIFAFWKLFGFEKDRHRYVKDIIFDIALFLFLFFIIYYLLGIIIGFTKTNYYNIESIFTFIVPIILYVIIREIFRYMIMCKSDGNTLVTAVTIIVFILLDITSLVYYVNFTSKVQIFKFIALTLLPAISSNVVFSWMTKKTGYKPIIFYALITELYNFLLPVVPNPSEYLISIINFLLPVILGWKTYLFFKKDFDEDVRRKYNKKRALILCGPAVITVIFVYLTSGYFHYYAVAIASGSMTGTINKGDVVLIEKIDRKFDSLKKGEIIAYRKDNRIIVHRLVTIIKEKDTYYFYTKGDANSDIDNFVIEENMVIGTIRGKAPYIGWPAVWLSEL